MYLKYTIVLHSAPDADEANKVTCQWKDCNDQKLYLPSTDAVWNNIKIFLMIKKTLCLHKDDNNIQSSVARPSTNNWPRQCTENDCHALLLLICVPLQIFQDGILQISSSWRLEKWCYVVKLVTLIIEFGFLLICFMFKEDCRTLHQCLIHFESHTSSIIVNWLSYIKSSPRWRHIPWSITLH